ncbi:hypothetical protein J14TS2_31400 [Bacillus sp. J14TS2]|nr:hypothetical protein J14TS2_31400 [Bacillus sp. J14TS2]
MIAPKVLYGYGGNFPVLMYLSTRNATQRGFKTHRFNRPSAKLSAGSIEVI